MKTNIFLNLSLIFLLALVAGEGWGQSLYEDFNYTAGQNVGGTCNPNPCSNNNWTTHSASNAGTIDVTATSLSYSGLQASIGNKIRIPGSNATTTRDINRAITGSGATIVYYSFLLNVADNTQLTTTLVDNGYFLCFGATSGNSVTALFGRVSIKSVNAGANYRLGVSNSSGGTPTYTEFATDLNFATTYLVVVKYDLNGGSNDVAYLWINPSSIGGSEPTGSVSNSSATTGQSTFASIVIRDAASTPKADIDEIRVGTTWASVTPASETNDANSVVSAGATGEPSTIASTIDTDGERILVFDVTFTDAGTADGFATIIDQIVFTQGSANEVADWTDAIAGAKLCGPDLACGVSDLAGTVGATNITFSAADFISVADGANETYQLKIWLQTDLSGITDNDILEFKLDFSNITCDVSGSSFGSGTPESGDANVSIDIDATKLLFVQQPSNTNINSAMSPSVTVEATDANNNRDIDFVSNIRITSTGTLTGTPVDVAASSGLATFATLTHTVAQTGRTLNAERTTGLDWDILSNTFDITVIPVTIVNWDFPSNPDNATADGGIIANNAKTISSSGTSAISYSFSGATTNSARATGWDAGSGTKYWQIEFVTTDYTTLKLFSKQRSSATGPRDFKAQYKVGAGGTWADITGATSIVVADDYTTGVLSEISLPTECDNQASVYIRWIMTTNDDASPPGTVASTGVSNIDDIIITGVFYSCSAPSTQASNITFTNVASATMTVNWVRGGTPGEGVIVLAKSVSAVDSDPVDGTIYTTNSVFGSGTQIGTGNYVVFMGSGTSVNLSGLSPGTTYYFKVYEYNCTGGDSKFNTTSPPSNSQVTTSCSTPTTQASNITFSAIGSSQMTVGWTNGNGEKRIVIINTSNSFTNPVNGTDPSANSIYSGAGEQVVYNNSGTSVTVNGLTSSTTYWFRVYEANCTSSNILFYTPTATNNPNSQATTAEIYSACGTEGFANGTTAPNGWTFTTIGGTYTTAGNYGASSPSLQFDATNDQIVTADVTSPSQLSFWLKGMSTDANCYFKVEGYNGAWVQIENINPIPTTGTTKTYGSVGTYTKFRFTYTKNNGNVAFDDVQVNCGGCTITSFPYTENFDGVNVPNLPCGWTITNNNSDTKLWKTSSGNPLSETNSMYIQKNTTVAMNDWFFTPMLDNLIGTSTYNLSFYYRNSISSKTEKLEVKWGTAANVAGMTGGTIFTNASISNEGYLQATGSFSPGSDGDYYIGFHGYSASNQSELYIDDISIITCTSAPSAPVEQAATNIDATFFTANWTSVASATKYYIDVSTVSDFSSFITGYNNKDVGNVTSYNMSGLNTNTTYYYRIRTYNSCGTSGNSGTINLTTLASGSATYLNQGDLVILAVNANLGSGGTACVAGADNGDEISFMCFKDITTGTEVQITENGYERCNTGQWGNTEGGAKLTRIGGTIPAGTVITFRTDMNAGSEIVFIYPDASWSVSHLHTTGAKYTNFNLNSGGDQIYFGSSGVWTNNTTNGHDAVYPGGSGKILFGFSSNPTFPWTASCTTNPTQRSNLYPLTDCLSMAPTGTSDFNKYTGVLTAATQREWIDRINNTANWTSYASCALFQSGGPQYDDGMALVINSGGFSSGTWNGAVDDNWFNCDNWQSLCIPDDTTNVFIPSSGVINESNIGAVGAECNALTIEASRILSINNVASTLTVYGNYDNEGTLTHSNGTFTFNGAALQTISGFSPSTFYNLTINNSSSAGITLSDNDITISNTLTLTDGVITTSTNKVNVSNSDATTSILGATNASFINGNLQRAITSNTNTYSFPVGDGTATTNFKKADFINNSLTGLSSLTVYVASESESGNNIDTRLAINQDGTPLNNIMESAIWTIEPQGGWSWSSGSYGVNLYVGNTGLSASDDNKFCPVKRANTSSDYAEWSTFVTAESTTIPALGGAGRIYSTGSGYAQRTGYKSFSKHSIAKGSAVLPIELVYFKAILLDKKVLLEWETASEINNDYFTLEKSKNGINFNPFSKVNGAGNSDITLYYSEIDNNPFNGISYYRLKQTDFDGKYSFSNIVSVYIENQEIIQNLWFNKDDNQINVEINSTNSAEYTITAYDICGKQIFNKKVFVDEKMNLKINTDNIPSGIYTISIISDYCNFNKKVVIITK